MSKIPVINVNMTNNFYMFNCIVGTNKFQINCLDAFSNNLFQHYLTSSLNLLNNFILPGMQLLSYIYNVLITHSFSSNPRLWIISLNRKKLEIYIIFLDWKKKNVPFLRKLSSNTAKVVILVFLIFNFITTPIEAVRPRPRP